MTIRFILNGLDVEINTEANRRLINILREQFVCTAAKCGCLSGRCGACSVLINDTITPSCLVPAFRIQESEIITLEGFSQEEEYQDIVNGFAKAGVENCGYCDAGKILGAELLLRQTLQPSKKDFSAAFRGIRCRCTDAESLYQGILAAGELRQRRMYGRTV